MAWAHATSTIHCHVLSMVKSDAPEPQHDMITAGSKQSSAESTNGLLFAQQKDLLHC